MLWLEERETVEAVCKTLYHAKRAFARFITSQSSDAVGWRRIIYLIVCMELNRAGHGADDQTRQEATAAKGWPKRLHVLYHHGVAVRRTWRREQVATAIS